MHIGFPRNVAECISWVSNCLVSCWGGLPITAMGHMEASSEDLYISTGLGLTLHRGVRPLIFRVLSKVTIMVKTQYADHIATFGSHLKS